MTGPIIPADQWPEGAWALVWDQWGQCRSLSLLNGTWFLTFPKDIPMPAGHDWRVPVLRPSAEQPAVDDDWHLRGYAYASKQATACAGCGEHKHTPLRIDAMGGYVCLTCIDQKLGTLLGEFGYPQPAPAVDLEQFRKSVDAAWACGGIDLAEAKRLLALIDGQEKGAFIVTPEMRAAFRAAYRSGGFWADRLDTALDAMMRACRPKSGQPTKGEGVGNG